MGLSLKKILLSPWTVMVITALMYLFKWQFKLYIGAWVNSPALIADGYHNLSDLITAGIVAFFGVYLCNRPKSDVYPYGMKLVEYLIVVAIGLILLALAGDTLRKSLSGLISLWPWLEGLVRPNINEFFLPKLEATLATDQALAYSMFAARTSALLSFTICRYEIRVGNQCGIASMVSDGKELKSDGYIEASSLLAFSLKFICINALVSWFGENALTAASIIEYALGLLLVILITITAVEMLIKAYSVLNMRSDPQLRKKIAELVTNIPGIDGVDRSMDKFRISDDGFKAYVIITATTEMSSLAYDPLTETIDREIRGFLCGELGFLSCEVFCKLAKPNFGFVRQGQGIIKSGRKVINAPTLQQATHLRVYDTEGDLVDFVSGEEHSIRAVDYPIKDNSIEKIIALIARLEVAVVSVFEGDDAERRGVEAQKVKYRTNLLLRVLIPAVKRVK